MSDLPANEPITQTNLMRHIAAGWDTLQAFLDTLSPAQMTQPVDAVGWTVKDHVIHLATWEKSLTFLPDGQSQRAGMEVDAATWASGDDAVNGALQARYRDLSPDEARRMHQQSHTRMLAKIASMTDEDLMRPYRDFQPDSTSEQPIYGWIVGNTFEHYREHQPWMAAIAEQG